MIPQKIWLAALCVTLVACGDKPPSPPKLSQVFSRLPLPPSPTLSPGRVGQPRIQITFAHPASRGLGRGLLSVRVQTDDWKLINDAKDKDGAVVLLAQRKTAVWVR